MSVHQITCWEADARGVLTVPLKFQPVGSCCLHVRLSVGLLSGLSIGFSFDAALHQPPMFHHLRTRNHRNRLGYRNRTGAYSALC